MMSILVVLVVLAIISILGILFSALFNDTRACNGFSISLLVCSFILFVMYLVSQKIAKQTEPQEFKKSEYELKIKVTELDGQKDTTYVLIPIKEDGLK